MKFRKKPVVVEAMQWDGTIKGAGAVIEWAGAGECSYSHVLGKLLILTPEGTMGAKPGDWIIKGVKGEFYPCKSDIFDATYERA